MDTNYTLFSSVQIQQPSDDRVMPCEVCIELPPHITSSGIWGSHFSDPTLTHYSFTILELQIIVIFALTQCFHFLLKRLGIPYYFSSVMAGFLLGPTLKIEALDKYKKMLFPFGSPDTLALVSSIGYTFYIFLSCVQMDFSMITRTGKKAWAIALSTLLTPILIGFTVTIRFGSFWFQTIGKSGIESLPIVFISHSTSSFPVIAALLNDLRILNSEIGRLALASALVSDVTGNIFSGILTAFVSVSKKGLDHVIVNEVALFMLVVMVPLIGRPSMLWVVRHTPEGKPVRKVYIYAIIALVLIIGSVANHFHLAVFAGAIVLGLAVPEGPPLGSELVHQLDLFSTWFLFPIFITTCIMKVDLTLCRTPKLLLVLAFFIIVVHLIRLVVCLVICRFCNMPTIDGICIALILSCKGAIDICGYTLIYDALKYGHEVVGVMIVSVLLIAIIAKFGVKSLYDPSRKYAGYQKRNILNLKPNSELRVVACIHKASHIKPIKTALELCCPTPINPMVVDVVHLLELVGRSSPIFISHRHQQKVVSTHNYSGEIILSFSLFEHDYAGAATVNTYTAISPTSLMHEDICFLAMDKIASIIILPFHVRWGEDGLVESEDNNIRSLNSKVMEKAPCSIGILVNRGSSSYNTSNLRVAMIFLGGPDDREALFLAKRSARESNNSLFVFRLLAKDGDTTNWDHMLDYEALREVQGAYGRVENVTYEELTAEDASQTTSFLNHVADKFDFIIVGRRNGIKSSLTDAMVNWTEYLELGAVGDLLASPDLNTRASILVVQQQQMPKS